MKLTMKTTVTSTISRVNKENYLLKKIKKLVIVILLEKLFFNVNFPSLDSFL